MKLRNIGIWHRVNIIRKKQVFTSFKEKVFQKIFWILNST